MIRFSFRKGLRFFERQRVWTLLRRLVNQKFQLEDEQGEVMTISQNEILAKWAKREFVVDEESISGTESVFYLATPRDLSTYREDLQAAATRRQHYLTKLGDHPKMSVAKQLQPHIKRIAAELGDANPPSPITIYRWWHAYHNTKSVSRLIDGRQRSGRPRITCADTFFEEALAKIYLDPQKHPASAVYDEMCLNIRIANKQADKDLQVTCPSRATVYRRIAALEQDLVDQARLGKRAAEGKYRPVTGSVKVKRILERIEVDHTPLDLIVIDEDTALPLGRPWLTVAIDRYSRMIMGFYVCFHEPSSFSILQCLKRAVLPKEAWLLKYPDIKEQWPCHGIPELIASDNGMDLHSDAFVKICGEMGIQLLFCPAKEPEYKGSVERFFRTISQGLIHRLPGSVFSNIDQRGDYPSEEVAAIDLKTLMHLMTKWVVEVYHCSKHRKLGMTPLAKWTDGLGERSIELPAHPEQMDVLVGIPAQRVLFRYGLEMDNLFYNSADLQAVFGRAGADSRLKLNLKYYEDDISYIHVLDPYNASYLRVPATDWDYAAGLTRHVHTLIQAAVRIKHGNRFNAARLLEAKAEIQEIVTNALSHKKMKMRKRGASLLRHDSESILRGEQSPLERAKSTPKSAKPAVPPPLLDAGLDDELPVFRSSERSTVWRQA